MAEAIEVYEKVARIQPKDIQVKQRLARTFAEGLPLFRRVNVHQAHAHRLLVYQHVDGVAVDDAHDLAAQLGPCRRGNDQDGQRGSGAQHGVASALHAWPHC